MFEPTNSIGSIRQFFACAASCAVGCAGQTFTATGEHDAADASDAAAAPVDAAADTSSGGSVDSGVDAAVETDAETPKESGAPADQYSESSADAPPPWSPAAIPGLALWLDGNRALSYSPGAVLTWIDQSGNGNDAIGVGTPTIDPGAIGGNTAVKFNGKTDYIVVRDSASLQFSQDDFSIAIVAAHTTPTTGQWGYGMLFSKQDVSSPPYVGPAVVANSLQNTGALFAQVALQSGSEVQTAETDFNSGRPFYLMMRRIAGSEPTLELYINGVESARATGPGCGLDVSAIGYPVRLGGTDKQQDVMGEIAEVVAVRGPLAIADLHALGSYLKAKYGL